MRLRSLFKSTLFHIIVIIVLSVGISFTADDDFNMPPAMTVELAKVSDITQTPKPAPKTTKPKEKDKPKPAKQNDKPKPSPTNTSNVPVAPAKDIKPPVEKPKPPQAKPKQLKKPDAVPLPKKEEEDNKKAEPPPPQRDFGSVLKNLADVEDEQANIDQNADDKPVAEEGHNAPLGATLTISEVDALRRQLENCWNVPIGARDVADMIIDVNLIVNPDRTVMQARIVDKSRYNSDSFFRAVADTAIRAVRSPACSPLELPEDKYDTWKNITVEFNPREMF